MSERVSIYYFLEKLLTLIYWVELKIVLVTE